MATHSWILFLMSNPILYFHSETRQENSDDQGWHQSCWTDGQYMLVIVVAHQYSDHLCNMYMGESCFKHWWLLCYRIIGPSSSSALLGLTECNRPDITVLYVSMLNVWLGEYCGLQCRKEKTDKLASGDPGTHYTTQWTVVITIACTAVSFFFNVGNVSLII